MRLSGVILTIEFSQLRPTRCAAIDSTPGSFQTRGGLLLGTALQPQNRWRLMKYQWMLFVLLWGLVGCAQTQPRYGLALGPVGFPSGEASGSYSAGDFLVSASGDSQSINSAYAGKTVVFNQTLRNLGDSTPVQLAVAGAPAGWNCRVLGNEGLPLGETASLGKNGEYGFQTRCDVPASAPNSLVTLTLTATASASPTVRDTTTNILTAQTVTLVDYVRIAVTPYGMVDSTVFLSKANGDLIESRSVSGATPGLEQVLEFTNVPLDAMLTVAYKFKKTLVSGTKDVVRLFTYPAKKVAGRNFEIGGLGEALFLQRVNFQNLPGNSGESVSSSFPVLGGVADFGGLSSVAITSSVPLSGLQSDGRYSLLFFLYGSPNAQNPLAYANKLDMPIPSSNNTSVSVLSGDWQNNLQTLELRVTNYPGYKLSNGTTAASYLGMRVVGERKGVIYDTYNFAPLTNFNPTSQVMNFNAQYAPGFFTTYGYDAGYQTGDETQALQPAQGAFVRMMGQSSLPVSVTLSTQSDFLTAPTAPDVTGVGTARPSLTWTATVPATAVQIVEVRSRAPSTYDYRWQIEDITPTAASFQLPVLPSELASFAPIEETTQKYRAEVRIEEGGRSPAGYKYAYASRNLAPGAALVQGIAQGAFQVNRDDPYAVRIR